MLAAAEELRFEEAARIRDELKELRADLDAIRGRQHRDELKELRADLDAIRA